MMLLRKTLQGIEKGLEALLQRTKEMEKMVDAIESVLTVEKPKVVTKAKAPRKKPVAKKPKKVAKKGSATDSVLNIIMKSDSAVTTDDIKKKTGLKERQIWGIINKAKKEGKIKMEKRGRYVKA